MFAADDLREYESDGSDVEAAKKVVIEVPTRKNVEPKDTRPIGLHITESGLPSGARISARPSPHTG